jgi:hypothetical protein
MFSSARVLDLVYARQDNWVVEDSEARYPCDKERMIRTHETGILHGVTEGMGRLLLPARLDIERLLPVKSRPHIDGKFARGSSLSAGGATEYMQEDRGN